MINLEESPFYIVSETKPWEIKNHPNSSLGPRRAGVSAFGFGGSNAHVILEEYIPIEGPVEGPGPSSEEHKRTDSPVLIPLSARSSERLQEYAKKILDFLKIDSINSTAAYLLGQYPEFDLPELAYTLQVGRDAMEERLIFLVKGIPELIAQLEAFTEGEENIANCWQGQVKQGKKAINLLTGDEDSQELIKKWIAKNRVEKIAELWVQGFPIDWELFYYDFKPRRISLPTYPFAKERYWIPETDTQAACSTANPAIAALIHPLLHQNTSDFSEQRFTSTFTGQEFFLADHVVKGRRILPGVACLEMARAAVEQAAGAIEEGQARVRLKNVVWVRPLAVGDQPVRVHIGLYPKDNGEIAWEIYSEPEAVDAEPVVHSQGSTVLSPAAEVPILNLLALQAQCTQSAISSIQCYEAYRAMGFEYGPGHRGIEQVYVGSDQLLAKLSLPSSVSDTRDQFVLQPSLMDSALQAALGLMMGFGNLQPALPFALQQVEIFNKCTSTMWTLIRYSEGSKTGDKVEKLDIDLCDETGIICVRMKGVSFRITSSKPSNVPATSGDTTEINTNALLAKVQSALVQAVSRLLKVKVGDIDVDTELNEYGFGSITFTEFANNLSQEYKLELTPTIFFEYPTLHSFAEYLIREHQAVFAAQFASRFAVQTGSETAEQAMAETPAQAVGGTPEQATADEAEQGPLQKRRRSRFARAAALSTPQPVTTIPEPIAIVGMSGIFPMAKDVDEFWRNLAEGRNCITEIPQDRWDWREYYGDPATEANKTNIKWGGFIEGVDEFDPLFFGISPKEAEVMDPQQRLLMTYIWKAIEDAGYSAQSLSGTKTGIFVGTMSSGYSGLISQANVAIEGYSSTGMVPSVGPNRMSYFLNIHGPSEPIETACSSSLVAIHRAVSAIENGTCEMAVVGGVNTILTPELHISFNKAGMLCADGRCKTFSDQANGYVRGEGVGLLFLKKLKAAEEAGDHIYGVIRGAAENHGGRANSLTAPNPKAQAELLITAYTKAGIDPRTVTYIEAHGTGTELGDPIEINGLKAAFKELYQATGDPRVTGAHCGLGSVKTNIGHLELAAGITGVIKVLLQLKHKTLVKSLHCDTINPYIQLKDSPFYIVRETKEWQALRDAGGEELPRRAGVSSFGFGGATFHTAPSVSGRLNRLNLRSDFAIARRAGKISP